KMYGFNLTFYRYLTIIIITLVISMAIKVIGVLLVSSLLIIPLLGAMRIGNNLKMTLIYSILITEFAVVGGIIIAFYLNISTSAIIVLLALLIYGLSIIGFKNN
nr:metal ABC transporter permease [Mycoplasmatales bacterium]